MEDKAIGTTIELDDVARILGECLTRLDAVGAGIAAIHVNAAVEDLAGLREYAFGEPPECTGDMSRFASFDPDLLCACPVNDVGSNDTIAYKACD